MSSKAQRSSFSTVGRVTLTSTAQALTGYEWRQNVDIPQTTWGTLSGGRQPYRISGISPALPSGLTVSISGASVLVNGSPTTAIGATCKVFASDYGGSSVGSETVNVFLAAPLITSLDTASAAWMQGVAISNVIPVSAAGGYFPRTWSISPPLPSGLQMTSTPNCLIYGTPTSSSASTQYTITCTDRASVPDGVVQTSSKIFTASVSGDGTYGFTGAIPDSHYVIVSS